MSEKRHSSVLFNKNASPFFPAGYASPLPYSNVGPPMLGGGPIPHGGVPPLEVELSHLPPQASLSDLEEFLAAQLPGWGFTVFLFVSGDATVLFASPSAARSAASTLNQRKWLNSEVQATLATPSSGQLLALMESVPPSDELVASSSSLAPHLPAQVSGPSNPYYYMPPPFAYPVNVDYGYYGPNPPMPYPPFGYYGVSPLNTRALSRRSSSRSISRQGSVNGSFKPSPLFLLNMVKSPESNSGESTPHEDAGEFIDDQGLISIEDDEGNTIRANPRRLFVGNIPFNSTWPALKNFLISRAEEIEPGNDIEILRVEIPMQQPRDMNSDISKLNSYQFLTLLSQQLLDKSQSPTPEISRANSMPGPGPTRGLSRGFAIVTTANKLSLDKIIKYFDNVEFEGRTLTVRFDRFPDFNNYVLQQLYPSNRNGQGSKPAFLSNLAFERNSFQQKFYYGNVPLPPYNHQRASVSSRPKTHHELNLDGLAESLGEIETGAGSGIEADSSHVQHLSDEEKARDLVNSFASRDLSI